MRKIELTITYVTTDFYKKLKRILCILSSSKMSVVFKKWTEEERRAHVRNKNRAYQAKKEERTTLTEKRVKEQEKQKKLDIKERANAGEWVSTGKAKTIEKGKQGQEKIVKKNAFSALESDEEKEEPKPVDYVRKKINWADDSDDE